MRTFAVISVFAVFLMLHPDAVCQSAGGESNKILAVVNEDVVTQADLDVAVNSAMDDLKKEYSGKELEEKVEQAKKDFLEQMIEDKLILQDAKKKGIAVDNSEVDQRFDEIKSRFPSEDMFYSEMQKSGVSLEMLKKRYRENIMMGKLVNVEVRDKVVVTPTEIENYYKQHSSELKAPESVHLYCIIVRAGENTSDELAKQKAEDVVKLARGGDDFGDLAKKYSQGAKAKEGGDFGFIEKGQMREDFEKVIFSLEQGDVSDPVKTDTGYYIFKVGEKKESRMRDLSESRDSIENIIFREKAQKRYQDWMAKLKRDAFIQVK